MSAVTSSVLDARIICSLDQGKTIAMFAMSRRCIEYHGNDALEQMQLVLSANVLSISGGVVVFHLLMLP